MNVRTRLVNFRVTDEEYEQLQQAAARCGARSLSDYARQTLLEDDLGRRVAVIEAVLVRSGLMGRADLEETSA
jgi:hypothetical protein